MSETTPAKKATAPGKTEGNTALPHQGDHDRVQMLSVKADGTPDQHNPELIGDTDATLAATKEQFQQQAVSALDVQDGAGGTVIADAPQDPAIQAKVDEHAAAASSAAISAEETVKSLTRD